MNLLTVLDNQSGYSNVWPHANMLLESNSAQFFFSLFTDQQWLCGQFYCALFELTSLFFLFTVSKQRHFPNYKHIEYFTKPLVHPFPQLDKL